MIKIIMMIIKKLNLILMIPLFHLPNKLIKLLSYKWWKGGQQYLRGPKSRLLQSTKCFVI